jgi:hypothetical protein
MRRRSCLFLVLSIVLLSGCAKTSLESNPPTPTTAPMVDSFFYGYAFFDTNNNGQLDESDTPLSDVQFTATDAKGASAGGKTDAEGRAMAWWPSESQYPVTLRMAPLQGYTLIGPQEVVLDQGASNANFLFGSEIINQETEIPPVETNSTAHTQYTLTAVLNYAAHFLAVDEQISYTNHDTETLNEILLVVEPQRYTGVFKLNGITLGDGTSLSPTWDDSWLIIALAQPLEPGQEIQISLSYELNLPYPQPSAVVRPVPFGYTERQTNLVDWYPFIPPRNPGQGWMTHKPGYFGEHLAYEYADFQVNIMISDVPASSFATPTPAGDQPAAGYAIAASAPDQIDGDWHRYQLESARNFVWSVSHAYQVFSKVIGEVTVLGYSFPAHSKAGQTALDVTARGRFPGRYGIRWFVLFEQRFL